MNAVLAPEDCYNFVQPDIAAIFRARSERLARIRANPSRLPFLKAFYKQNLAHYITDWGCTFDPRNASPQSGRPAFLPFILQPKQIELVNWMVERWQQKEPGLVEKSRDIGASWVAMALAVSICTLWDGASIGFGSATEDKLDRAGDPDSLFWKGRLYVQNLPKEFRGGCDIEKDAPDKRILFPATGASITGEIGDRIGHGGRKTLYVVDEAAHVMHPKLMDSGLSGTTDCRIDMSSVSIDGMANAFAVRRHSGRVKVFTYHYRDYIGKDETWAKKKRESTDPLAWAANYELDYTGAAENVVIPQKWAQACLDAHKKLGIEPQGAKRGALDVADLGSNLNAFAARHGILLSHLEVWPGSIQGFSPTVERAYRLCDEWMLEGFSYDAEGVGAGCRESINQIQTRRVQQRLRRLRITPYRGSNAVFQPEQIVPGTDRKAKDFFANLKAQAYWGLRQRAYATFMAVNGGEYEESHILSIDSRIPDVQKILIEMSQPQWKLLPNGKMVIDKTPDGALSPDRSDAVAMAYAPVAVPLKIADTALEMHEDY